MAGTPKTGPRPGDTQPAARLLHIAYPAPRDGGRVTQYLCGEPVRRLIGRAPPGHGPRGGGVCPVCARVDELARFLDRVRGLPCRALAQSDLSTPQAPPS